MWFDTFKYSIAYCIAYDYLKTNSIYIHSWLWWWWWMNEVTLKWPTNKNEKKDGVDSIKRCLKGFMVMMLREDSTAIFWGTFWLLLLFLVSSSCATYFLVPFLHNLQLFCFLNISSCKSTIDSQSGTALWIVRCILLRDMICAQNKDYLLIPTTSHVQQRRQPRAHFKWYHITW